MSYLELNYPGYDCDEYGNIFKFGNKIKPFKSNKYYQVCLYDTNHKKCVLGVHTVIAMKYLDWFKGCVVHHKDGNPHNNKLENLEIKTKNEHCRLHAKENLSFCKSNLGKPAWNKGMKMSKEFRKKCSDSAKRRWSK